MRKSTLIMIAVAAVFGLMAVFVAQAWLNRQAEARMKVSKRRPRKPVAAQTLVVAAQAAAVRQRTRLQARCAKFRGRKARCRPAASQTIQEFLSSGQRVVLARDRAQRAGARVEDHRRRPARDAVRDHRRRHEGRHHPRQRRRWRRRLRAAGRSRRRYDDAPARKDVGDERRRSAERPACSRSTSSRTSAPTSRRSPRRSRSKSTSSARRSSSLASQVGSLVARAAQGRRSRADGHASRHACRSC